MNAFARKHAGVAPWHSPRSRSAATERKNEPEISVVKPAYTASKSDFAQDVCSCGGGCPRCQAAPVHDAGLEISEPGDRLEQEADRVARRVVATPAPAAEPPASAAPAPEPVNRKTPDEGGRGFDAEEPEQEAIGSDGRGERMAAAAAAPPPPGLPEGGVPLSPGVREYFEPRFARDFSAVRIHTNSDADRTARDLDARAFTARNHIYFRNGGYRPETGGGRQLLAHELTHVAQQGEAPSYSRGGPTVSVTSTGVRLSREVEGGDVVYAPLGGAPGRVSDDEQLESSTYNIEGDIASTDANLTGQPLTPVTEGDDGATEPALGECPDLVNAIAEPIAQAPSPVDQDDFYEQGVSFLPSPFDRIAQALVGDAFDVWKRLPVEARAAAIDRMIRSGLLTIQSIEVESPSQRFMKWVLLAFLRRLLRAENSRKIRIAEQMGTLILGRNVDFAWGLLKGLVVGFIVDGLVGLIQMIIDIVCLIPKIFAFIDRVLHFIELFPRAIQNLIRRLKELRRSVERAIENLLNDLVALYRNPERIAEFLERIDEYARSMAEQIGQRGADLMLRAFGQPLDRVGYAVGRVIGMILFEIVMAVVAAAISAYVGGSGAVASVAVSAGKTALRSFMGFLRRMGRIIMRMIRPLVRYVGQWMDTVKDFVVNVGRALSRAWGVASRRLGQLLDQVKEMFQRFLYLIGESRFFLQFMARVRLEIETLYMAGVPGPRLLRKVLSLWRRPQYRRALTMPRVKAADNRGYWIVKTSPRPSPIKVGIAEALMDRRTRWDTASDFIQDRIDEISPRHNDDEHIEEDLRPYVEPYQFTSLKSEPDEREKEYEIIGSMSPEDELASKPFDWPTGDRDDPIPIRWFRREEVYPEIRVYETNEDGERVLEDRGRPYDGVELPGTMHLNAQEIQITPDNMVPDDPIKKQANRGSESKKDQVGRRLRDDENIEVIQPSGIELTSYQIDHAHELRLGGEDDYDNLWPVKASYNRAFNANFNQKVWWQHGDEIKKGDKVKDLNGKWFEVDDQADSVPSSAGGHDTRNSWPINRGRATGGVRRRIPRRRDGN